MQKKDLSFFVSSCVSRLRNSRAVLAVFCAIAFTLPLIAEEASSDALWKRQPNASTNLVLNLAVLKSTLETKDPNIISLPLPENGFTRFYLEQSELMPSPLAKKFPEIKTFIGIGIDDSTATAQIDLSPRGFHAQIISSNGTVYIDPVSPTNNLYTCRYSRDGPKPQWKCADTPQAPEPKHRVSGLGGSNPGNVLRTYRIAVAAQGEFTQHHGGTVSSGMAAIVTVINRVNGIYQSELGIRFVLVANNEQLVYTDPETDPFSGNGYTEQILLENQQNTDRVIGSPNYDLGIALNTSGQGLAYGSSVCVENYKARSVIGSLDPLDYFAVGFVAHEIGHQFGALHTFNSQTGICYGRRFANTAYEPGSGSSIMGYAGFCNDDDLQDQRDGYFHSISLDEITTFLNGGGTCASVVATGNNPPSANAGPNYAIPQSTPFTLTASGSDPDGDRVTYCWEQRDLGPPQTVYDSDNGSSPLFRSFSPTTNPSRTFLRMSELLRNTRLRGEQLPTTSRTMNFRVTVRDGKGGFASDDTQIRVVASAGPFAVTEPNSFVTWTGKQTVRWNVAGTTLIPISTASVRILLSTDGGNSFPITLLTSTANDGSENVILPNVNTSLARIKVEAIGNIFFDVSDANFQITSSGPAPSPGNTVGANDFNNDGHGDLLLRNNAGALTVKFFQEATAIGSATIRNGQPVPTEWRFVGMTDFNGDGSRDFLWQHTDGRCAVWLMNGIVYEGFEMLRNGQASAPGWQVTSLGDFNADGSTDLFFKNTQGQMAVWFMSGTAFLGSSMIRNGTPAPSGWKVAGTGDFNFDNHSDILFHHDNGKLAVWLMNGTALAQGIQLRNGQAVAAGWRVVTVTDFNSDGRSDIVWIHNSGKVAVWLMDGTAFVRSLLLLP